VRASGQEEQLVVGRNLARAEGVDLMRSAHR
jgi:hypothetical protein